MEFYTLNVLGDIYNSRKAYSIKSLMRKAYFELENN